MRMIVEGDHGSLPVESVQQLKAALRQRDSRGGGEYWISREEPSYPKLVIICSGNYADVLYFPEDGGHSYRRSGGHGLPEGGTTCMVFVGCDPGDGEETPNEFIVTCAEAEEIAEEFFIAGSVSCASNWLEL